MSLPFNVDWGSDLDRQLNQLTIWCWYRRFPGKPDSRYEHIQSMINSLPACVGHMDIDISCSILIFVFYNSWLSHMKYI